MPRQRLTLPRIAAFNPPSDGFLWDEDMPRLAVRARASGAKSFIFKGTLNYREIRITIGSADAWTIEAARDEARKYQRWIEEGRDPRDVLRQQEQAREAEQQAERIEVARAEVTFRDAWLAYVEERGPKWVPRYRDDHLYAIAGKDKPQPLASLVDCRLADLDEKKVSAWLAKESAKRPTQAAGAFRKLRAFANWCAESEAYAGLVDPAVFKQKRVVEAVPKPKAKDDCLQREQLPLWFEHVRRQSPTQAAYLQALLITGARKEELAGLRWEDVDFQWKSMRIRDKMEGERVIPLTPHVAGLLIDLKRCNQTPPPAFRIVRGKKVANDLDAWEPSPWVFAGRGESGRIVRPNHSHDRALTDAGLPPLTLHGLRRSFGTLSEWVEVPVGVVAQIQGHKPSALAEKHYRRRPLDLLRVWHTKVESWILEQAGIEQPTEQEAAPALRVVA